MVWREFIFTSNCSKRTILLVALLIASLFFVSSCIKMPKNEEDEQVDESRLCSLRLAIDKESFKDAIKIVEESKDETSAKGTEDLKGNKVALDTANYLLKIADSKGNIVYDGLYKDRPEILNIKSGTYTISLLSGDFKEPQVDIPLFGEEKSIKAKADSTMVVRLTSRQLTGGIRIKCTKNFTKYFLGTGLYLRNGKSEYKQLYAGTYKYVFFYPSEVSVVYKNKDGHPSYTPYDKPQYEDTIILTRKLKANDLVSITLDYDLTEVKSSGISFGIDTNRNRYDNIYNVAFFAPYGSVSVVYAKSHIGDTVRLYGYIVGSDAWSTGFKRVTPFTSKTHIVVAKEDWQALRSNTMAVELPNGNIRKELNLVDNPTLLKRKIVIDGVVTDSYFGYPGLKSVTSYRLY